MKPFLFSYFSWYKEDSVGKFPRYLHNYGPKLRPRVPVHDG